MSFNRSGYIGRAPGDSTVVLAKQYFQPTGAGKTFTFTAGYDPGLIDVYRNGVKLINVLDYAATDGSTIVLDTPVGVGSTVQVVAYKGFNLTAVNHSSADFTVGNNLYVQSGFGSFGNGLTANEINVSGITTTVDLNVSGAATVSGTLVAGAFSGDGSALTGVGQTLNVRTESLTVAGVSTLTGVTNVTGVANFASAINADATTDSTSTSTGALIVDGGVGIAKNVYIGAGLSVAGTLTYEDVTSVDSVGLITAKSGVNITGGELTVGSGITMGIAGVTTFSGTSDVHLLDNIKLLVGDGSDVQLYHNGSTSYLDNTTGSFYIRNAGSNDDSDIHIQAVDGEESIVCQDDGSVDLYFNNNKVFETTTDGTVTTGIGTFTGGLEITSDNKYLRIGAATGGDLQLFHNGTNSLIKNLTGDLVLESDSLKLRSESGGEVYIQGTLNGAVDLRYDDLLKLSTTNEGIEVIGFTSTTAGMGVTGGLFEGAFIKAGKLTDNLQIGIATANVFYFTTTETTTGTPNIRWNDNYSLSSKMAVGDVTSVTVITTAAAAGYCANWTIDGAGVTEEWVGGSTPSAGGDNGLDIYSFTIIKTGTGTGDSGFKVIANVSNAT